MVGNKCLKVAEFEGFFFVTSPSLLVISMFGRQKADTIILVTGKQCENSGYMSQEEEIME